MLYAVGGRLPFFAMMCAQKASGRERVVWSGARVEVRARGVIGSAHAEMRLCGSLRRSCLFGELSFPTLKVRARTVPSLTTPSTSTSTPCLQRTPSTAPPSPARHTRPLHPSKRPFRSPDLPQATRPSHTVSPPGWATRSTSPAPTSTSPSPSSALPLHLPHPLPSKHHSPPCKMRSESRRWRRCTPTSPILRQAS